jgi:hypothetical protein
MSIPCRSLARDLLTVGIYNTAIGLFLTAVTPYGVAMNLIYANCIGFSIFGSVRGSWLILGQAKPHWINDLIGIPAGFAIGFVIATWLNDMTLTEVLTHESNGVLIAGATAALFGAIGTWYFHDEARFQEALSEVRAERLRRIEQESAATRSELALLQAQIEPHFLFNTLSNVVGLIDANPVAARTMLLDLTALLRTTLARTRRPSVTLGEEMDLLRAYLGIMAVRMGPRLAWEIDADAEVLSAWLPPLLVQPLVENAIRHGLEPKPAGGRLTIRCRRQDGFLDVVVADSGCGFPDDAADGVGLANVRKRLQAAGGAAASLTLTTAPGGGVTAALRLPFVDHEPAHSDR